MLARATQNQFDELDIKRSMYHSSSSFYYFFIIFLLLVVVLVGSFMCCYLHTHHYRPTIALLTRPTTTWLPLLNNNIDSFESFLHAKQMGNEAKRTFLGQKYC